MEKDKLIDNAVSASSLAILRNKRGASTQINNMINFLQSDKSEYGIKKLMLYITRQMSRTERRQAIIDPDFGSKMIEDLQTILKKENAPSIAEDYLLHIKWAFEALSRDGIKLEKKINSFDQFLQEVKK